MMTYFRSLRARLFLSLIAMLLTIIVIGLGSYFSLQNTIEAFQVVVNELMTEIHYTRELQIIVLQAAMPANDYLVHGRKNERKNFRRLSHDVNEQFDLILSLPTLTPEKRKLIQAAHRHWRHASMLSKEILGLSRPMGNPVAIRAMEHMDRVHDKTVEILAEFNFLSHKDIEAHLANAKQAGKQAFLVLVIVLVAGTVIVFTSGIMLVRSILTPIQKLQDGVMRFGLGDHTYRVELVTDDEIGQLAGSFNNMADRLEQNQNELKELSTHDSLTGLLNRREIVRRLDLAFERYKRYQRRFSLLLLDLDHFKDINDTHGHQAGDLLLKTFSLTVSQVIRPVDQFSRYGGEEFIILMPEIDAESARVMAERIRSLVESLEIELVGEKKLKFTVSIGVAGVSERDQDWEATVRAADKALYTAKNAGRNRVCSV